MSSHYKKIPVVLQRKKNVPLIRTINNPQNLDFNNYMSSNPRNKYSKSFINGINNNSKKNNNKKYSVLDYFDVKQINLNKKRIIISGGNTSPYKSNKITNSNINDQSPNLTITQNNILKPKRNSKNKKNSLSFYINAAPHHLTKRRLSDLNFATNFSINFNNMAHNKTKTSFDLKQIELNDNNNLSNFMQLYKANSFKNINKMDLSEKKSNSLSKIIKIVKPANKNSNQMNSIIFNNNNVNILIKNRNGKRIFQNQQNNSDDVIMPYSKDINNLYLSNNSIKIKPSRNNSQSNSSKKKSKNKISNKKIFKINDYKSNDRIKTINTINYNIKKNNNHQMDLSFDRVKTYEIRNKKEKNFDIIPFTPLGASERYKNSIDEQRNKNISSSNNYNGNSFTISNNTNSINNNIIINNNNYINMNSFKKNPNKINQDISEIKKTLTSFPINNVNKFPIKIKYRKISPQTGNSPRTMLYNISPTNKINSNQLRHFKITSTKKILKIDSCSLPGKYPYNTKKKIHLDSIFIKKNFLYNKDNFCLGICSGHGTQGHLISEYVSENLPNYIKNYSIEQIKNAYISTNNLVSNNNTKFNSSTNGTSCITLIITPNKIICANIGDCRGILAKNENGNYKALQLSRDHLPSEPDEMERIIENGGRIKEIWGENNFCGVEKIFLKNSEIPGLNISRSIGDSIAHNIGVISDPEIKIYEFNGNEKFIILGNNWIWKYMSNNECVDIVKSYYENNYDAKGCMSALIKEAYIRKEKNNQKNGDITAIVIFFN